MRYFWKCQSCVRSRFKCLSGPLMWKLHLWSQLAGQNVLQSSASPLCFKWKFFICSKTSLLFLWETILFCFISPKEQGSNKRIAVAGIFISSLSTHTFFYTNLAKTVHLFVVLLVQNDFSISFSTSVKNQSLIDSSLKFFSHYWATENISVPLRFCLAIQFIFEAIFGWKQEISAFVVSDASSCWFFGRIKRVRILTCFAMLNTSQNKESFCKFGLLGFRRHRRRVWVFLKSIREG